jgi:hypothetical protein
VLRLNALWYFLIGSPVVVFFRRESCLIHGRRTTNFNYRRDNPATVLDRMDETRDGIKEHVEHVFSNKFLLMTGTLVGAFVTIVGVWSAVENELTTVGKVICAVAGGLAICLIVWALSRRESAAR